MEDKTLTPPQKQRKSRAGQSIKQVNLEKLQKQLLTIASREVMHLLEKSFTTCLNQDERFAFTTYVKLVKSFKHLAGEPDLTDAELAEIAGEDNE